MRPIILKGHERSITALKYNRDGDLLFSASKDVRPVVWYTDNGERLGTYNGHNGAIWAIDVSRKSEYLITASADASAKIWNVETGKEVMNWTHKAPVRCASFGYGDKQFLTATDQVFGLSPSIYIWDISSDPRLASKPVLEIQGRNEAKILHAMYGPVNEQVVTACEDGTVRIYDVRNGDQLKVISDHTKAVMQVSYDKLRTTFITSSKDGTARLYDAKTFKLLKTYSTGRPVNSASISPDDEYEIVIVGGGQSAESVTTTRVDSSQFRVKFYHTIYQEELGSVGGHFGPINVVSFSPDGRGFTSGGEDGYIRVHHFDKSYFTNFSKEAFTNRKRQIDSADDDDDEE